MTSEACEGVFVDVFPLDELLPGTQRTWQHGLQRVLLCRSAAGQVHAMLDLCPHARQAMAGGRFDDSSVTCPKHGACFDIRSGAPLNSVTPRSLRILRTRIRVDVIQVSFD